MLFEMSLVSKVFSSFLLYIISFFFFTEVNKYLDVSKGRCLCFLVQSFIIILAIFSESFFSFTASLRSAVNDNHELSLWAFEGERCMWYQILWNCYYVHIYCYLSDIALKDFKYGILLLLPICLLPL